MVKNIKVWISRERKVTFPWSKKIINLCLRWHILRSYRFEAEVAFNGDNNFAKYFASVVTLMLKPIGRIGTISILSDGTILGIFPASWNLSGEKPGGYKRKYSCNIKFILIFRSILWIFASTIEKESLFSFFNW